MINNNLAQKLVLVTCTTILSMYLAMNTALAQGHLQSWNTNQRERSQRYLSAAMTALNKGMVDHAATLLIQATGSDPADPIPFAVLGMTYMRQAKYSEALEALKKSYQMNKNAETLLSTGFVYYLQHDYDAAIAAWTKALERDPRMVEANADIGFAYMRKGDFQKADESFRILIRARPSSQLAYQGLAVINYLAGNFSAARKAAEHAQSIQSYYPVLLLLAKLDFLQGDPQTGQKRVSEWSKASTGKRALVRSMTALGYPTQHDFNWDPFLQDNFDNGRLLLARMEGKEKKGDSQRKSLAQKGKIQPLMASAKQADFSTPHDFYILRELALLEMANGETAASADHFREVLQVCPNCKVDWLHLARALALTSKTSEASYAVREFQHLKPSERIAAPFAELAKGDPAAIPELTPEAVPSPKRSGGNDSGF